MKDYIANERDTLERMVPKWEEQGFEVYLHPTESIMPPFLERYQPDAILLRENEKVVVEVIRKGQAYTQRKINQIQSLFAEQTEWRLEVVYVGEAPEAVQQVDLLTIKNMSNNAKSLQEIEPRASLLLLWATLEAIARHSFLSQTKRPQSPGRVVELLAGKGMITPSEAQFLRNLSKVRNRFIHGELDTTVDTKDINEMHSIIEGMTKMIGE